jgi:hypothetical protein
MTRGLLFSTVLVLATSCTVTAYKTTQQGQTNGSGATTQTTPTPTPTPAPTPTPTPDMATAPAPTPTPTPTPDMATAATPDMATSSANCTTLNDCCAELQDPSDQQMCMDAVTNLNDSVCAAILKQLQDNGLCM